MKLSIYAALIVALLVSCEKDHLGVDSVEVTPRSNTVPICHLNPDGSYRVLHVNQNALQAHLNHGDFLPDADGDGYTAIDACTGSMDDCDDSDPSVHPGAAEICYDGVDNNCDGSYSDGGCETCPCYSYENIYDFFTTEGCSDEPAYYYLATEPVNAFAAIVLYCLDTPARVMEYSNFAYVENDPVTYLCQQVELLGGAGFYLEETPGQYLACNEVYLRFAKFLECPMEQGLNLCD